MGAVLRYLSARASLSPRELAACGAELAAAPAPPWARGGEVRGPCAAGGAFETARSDLVVDVTVDRGAARLAAALAGRADQPSGLLRVRGAARLRAADAFAIWREAAAAASVRDPREDAAALDAKLAPYAATVAGLRAAAGGGPPPPDAAQAARAARAAAAALEDDEKLGDVARAMSWLIDQGAVPTRLWAADLGAPAADPARGLAVVRLRAVALLAPALAEAPLPLPLRQARRS